MKYFILGFMILFTTVVSATGPKLAPPPKKKKAQTSLGLYINSKDAADFLNKDSSSILIDVRTPEEVMFTGIANRTNIHIPIYLVDQSEYNSKKRNYAMMTNGNFLKEIEIELKRVKAKKDNHLFVMCRSGSSRSPVAVELIKKLGYTKIYSVLNGFEGGKRKKGNIGARTVSGWKNSGFKWGYKAEKNVLWFDNQYDK